MGFYNYPTHTHTDDRITHGQSDGERGKAGTGGEWVGSEGVGEGDGGRGAQAKGVPVHWLSC